MAMNKFFRIPFATSGDKIAVPDASQPSGSVSYTDGFGPDYELDPGVDPAAKDVPRDETNQLYFDITNAIKEYQEFGVPDFITSALNGGSAFSYAKYARVKWTDGKVYESRVNANTSDPSNATNWRVLTDNADYLTIATTAFEASVVDGEAVYWDGTQFDEAIADGTNKQNVIGFADVTNGRVFVTGLYAGQLSGLTANTVYYLSGSSAGAITTIAPSTNVVRMGIARTSTTFFVAVAPLPNTQSDVGRIDFFALTNAPPNYLKANGAAVSRTTYAALFAALVTTPGFTAQAFTVTIASPAVFTKAAHGFAGGERLRFSTTGSLPTGLNTTTDYYVQVIDANSFYVTTTPGGYATLVNTSGSQSGTHSYTRSYFGLGDGSTTFNLPDLRSEFIRGFDDGRGVDIYRSFGSAQKGSLHNIDAGSTAAVVGDRSASTAVGAVAQNYLGLDDEPSLLAYPNALSSSAAATAQAAPVNNSDIGYGIMRPRNVSLLACIKFQ